jgi:hypothetical protein
LIICWGRATGVVHQPEQTFADETFAVLGAAQRAPRDDASRPKPEIGETNYSPNELSAGLADRQSKILTYVSCWWRAPIRDFQALTARASGSLPSL